jgi:hypothetical protein
VREGRTAAQDQRTDLENAMLSLITRLFARRPAARRPVEARPRLEGLEIRMVPSAVTGHPRRRPEPGDRALVRYIVDADDDGASDRVRRRIAKRNILAAANLPPGSYSHSY